MRTVRVAMFVTVIACSIWPAAAQDTNLLNAQRLRAAQAARESYREQLNENVLFIMGGQPGTSYVNVTNDMAQVVNDGLRLRLLPVLGNAAAQNIGDLIFLRGVDLALTTTQVLDLLRDSNQYGPNLDRQLVYIAPLANEEMHVLARPGINAIEELQGKVVSFDSAGSATALLGPKIFSELKIEVQGRYLQQVDALQAMRSGSVDATVCICAKPLNFISQLGGQSGFKLLEVPFIESLRNTYLPASLTPEDYGQLLGKGTKVETIATTMALVSFNWPKASPRYARTARFVDALFSKFGELQRPPRHPSWQSVNIAAAVPGWQRFGAAQEWLDRNVQPTASLRASFNKVMSENAGLKAGAPGSIDSEKLFREFMDFMRKEPN